MKQNIANFLYSNFLGRTSKKKHPVGKVIQKGNIRHAGTLSAK